MIFDIDIYICSLVHETTQLCRNTQTSAENNQLATATPVLDDNWSRARCESRASYRRCCSAIDIYCVG